MKKGYGTIQGFTHRKLEYNNQDFVLVSENEDYNIVLIVWKQRQVIGEDIEIGRKAKSLGW